MAEKNISLLLSSNICAEPLITNIYYMYMYVHAYTCDLLTYSRNLIQQAIFAVNISKLYLNVLLRQLEVEYVFAFIDVKMGFIAMAIFLHVLQRFANVNRSCAMMISNGVNPSMRKADLYLLVAKQYHSHTDPPGKSYITAVMIS